MLCATGGSWKTSITAAAVILTNVILLPFGNLVRKAKASLNQ